jgi:hypothetical protein
MSCDLGMLFVRDCYNTLGTHGRGTNRELQNASFSWIFF